MSQAAPDVGISEHQPLRSGPHHRFPVWQRAITFLAGVVAILLQGAWVSTSQASDSEEFRTYVQIRSGEIAPMWGVDDHWGVTFGANLSRHWGLELAIDSFEKTFEPDAYGTLGEESSTSLAPQVRFRWPMLHDRLVPYVLAGAGVSFLQFNDRTLNGYGRLIDADDTRLALIGGVGLEYFIADNIAFGLEGKYTWIDTVETTIDGRSEDLDMSAMMATFGFRIYFRENEPRPLVSEANSDVKRFFFGMRFGGAVLTDNELGPGVKFEAEAQAIGGSINQFAGFALGADFGRNWGLELTVGGSEWVPIISGIGGIGEYAVVSVLPAIRYRYPIHDGRWVPYLLVGGGGTFHEFNDARYPGSQVQVRETKGFSPAVAAGGGVEYFFARNVSLGAELRWHYTWDHTIQINGGPTIEGDLSDFQFMLNMRLYLLEWGKDRQRSH